MGNDIKHENTPCFPASLRGTCCNLASIQHSLFHGEPLETSPLNYVALDDFQCQFLTTGEGTHA